MIYLKREQTCNGTGGFTFHVKDGKKFITPAFIEVPMDTDFKDVIVEPKPPRAEDLPDKVWKFTGSKGNEYEVKRANGGFTCTCPASMFQRNKECKHIREVKITG
jgi:hypothetical protein